LSAKIVLVDDHPIFRKGLSSLISLQPGYQVTGEASTRSEALDLTRKQLPDLILVDLSLGGESGLELIKDLKVICPQTGILVLSMHDETLYAERALMAGAEGYVEKKEVAQKVLEAIHTVLVGRKWFSPDMKERLLESFLNGRGGRPADSMASLSDREFEVFSCIGRGLGSSRIAEQLGLSVRTIDTYKEHLKLKLHCRDTQELRIKATEWVAKQ
jgi:DNA-binding NarL/FixJ family response regulator